MRRPIDIWIASGYLMLYGSGMFGVGLWFVIQSVTDAGRSSDIFTNLILAGSAASVTTAGAFLAAAGYGVWALRNWGRLVGFATLGFLVISDVVAIVRDIHRGAPVFPSYFAVARTAFQLLVIAYLLRPATRDLFIQRSSGR